MLQAARPRTFSAGPRIRHAPSRLCARGPFRRWGHRPRTGPEVRHVASASLPRDVPRWTRPRFLHVRGTFRGVRAVPTTCARGGGGSGSGAGRRGPPRDDGGGGGGGSSGSGVPAQPPYHVFASAADAVSWVNGEYTTFGHLPPHTVLRAQVLVRDDGGSPSVLDATAVDVAYEAVAGRVGRAQLEERREDRPLVAAARPPVRRDARAFGKGLLGLVDARRRDAGRPPTPDVGGRSRPLRGRRPAALPGRRRRAPERARDLPRHGARQGERRHARPRGRRRRGVVEDTAASAATSPAARRQAGPTSTWSTNPDLDRKQAKENILRVHDVKHGTLVRGARCGRRVRRLPRHAREPPHRPRREPGPAEPVGRDPSRARRLRRGGRRRRVVQRVPRDLADGRWRDGEGRSLVRRVPRRDVRGRGHDRPRRRRQPRRRRRRRGPSLLGRRTAVRVVPHGRRPRPPDRAGPRVRHRRDPPAPRIRQHGRGGVARSVATTRGSAPAPPPRTATAAATRASRAPCHGTSHAEWSAATDSTTSATMQGHPGAMVECDVCHVAGSLPLTTQGPHGLHNVGDARWALGGHGSFYAADPTGCQACHGKDLAGTRPVARGDRAGARPRERPAW